MLIQTQYVNNIDKVCNIFSEGRRAKHLKRGA